SHGSWPHHFPQARWRTVPSVTYACRPPTGPCRLVAVPTVQPVEKQGAHSAISPVFRMGVCGYAPNMEVKERHVHQAHVAPGAVPGPIVFVVDDDRSVRESLAALISAAGWQPETYSAAQEFLSRPVAEVPSCLVLDMGLSRFSGLELQAQLAARSNVPIIC